MDTKTQVTVVSVHSPSIQFSSGGGYYTSYAISLKSNNPCFTHSYSQTRRRYSEFRQLRHLLIQHHPTLSKPPILPPKNYFYRFGDDFIEERKNGLQTFLEKVLATPVYLSDKGLHLFLQSSIEMSQIEKQCLGDFPRPQLMDDDKPFDISCHSDSCSTSSTESSDKKKILRTLQINKNINMDSSNFESEHSSPDVEHNSTVPPMPKFERSRPCSIPKRAGSLDSSPCSSASSLDTGYASPMDFNRSRRVSFNDKVTVAVVYNQLWSIDVRPIRTDM